MGIAPSGIQALSKSVFGDLAQQEVAEDLIRFEVRSSSG